MPDIERTYVMIKPDGVARGLVGRILSRFEDAGLTLIALRRIEVTKEQSTELYREHVGKPFYEKLLNYIHSGPVVASVWEGPGAVALCRKVIGATNPAEAAPGTIRGDFGMILDFNVVHGSDSPASGQREIPIFFPEL